MPEGALRPASGILLLALPLVALPVRAQAPLTDLPALAEKIAAGRTDKETFLKGLKQALGDPAVLNAALTALTADTARWRLLKNLNLQFTTLQAADSSTLGLTYGYSRNIKNQPFAMRGASHTGLNLDLAANGTIAFERSVNPRDFLTTEVELTAYRSRGGALASSDSIQSLLNDLELVMADIDDRAELQTHPAFVRFMRTATSYLSDQLYLQGGGTVRLESDQTFDRTQWVYAASVGVDAKAWNPRSRLAQWNLFDWPMAAIRYLAGVDRSFTPLGSAFPTLIVELGLVDPAKDPTRAALGAPGSYPRIRIESALRSPLLDASRVGLIFEADFRYYKELGAPAAIATAGLDDFTYFVAALVAGNGLYASYSTGKLPFDASSDQVYDLGFRLHF